MPNKIKIILIIIALVILVFLIILWALIKDDYRPMKYEDFVNFKTELVANSDGDYLVVSGQYSGSSLKIRTVETEFENGNIMLNIYTTLFGHNNSSFVKYIELDNSIDKILFGDEKKVIWQRNQ